jgi:phosphoacetylglucosamine mutase
MLISSASKLPCVVFRTALLAALRSKQLSGATIGVMITASHNPAIDNGVKIVDPTGEMLEQSWEIHATALANSPISESLSADLKRLAQQLEISLDAPASIVFARDTRPSGVELTEALTTGLKAFGDSVKFTDVGIATTPVLHHVVAATNDKSGLAGEPTFEGYLSKLSKAFDTATVSPVHFQRALDPELTFSARYRLDEQAIRRLRKWRRHQLSVRLFESVWRRPAPRGSQHKYRRR